MRRFLPLLVLVLLAAPSRAEEENLARTMPFMVQDRHRARLALDDLDRSLEKGRIRSALRTAQQVLDEMQDDLVLVESTRESTRWRPAVEAAKERLGRLDPASRTQYDRLAERQAGPLMARARREGDPTLLAELVRRFGASRIGRDAARVLSGQRLEAGHPRDAAWWAEEGLRFFPDDALLGAHRDAGRARVEDPERVSVVVRDGPVPEETRWTVRIPFLYRTQDHEITTGFIPDDRRNFWNWWEGFRPLHPAVDETTAYVGNGRALYAIDLFSGRRRWTLDTNTGDGMPLIPPGVEGQGRTSYGRVFAPQIADDLVIGTVELDRPYEPEHIDYVEISTYLPHRALVAVDRKSGDVRWWMGGQARHRLELEGRSIVSPCVVAEDVVCAVTARYTGTYFQVGVVALDRRTGAFRWHRVLGVGQQEQNLFGAPVKEMTTGAPTVKDGVLYATSGLGFLAALDLRSGRERWLASHEIHEIQVVHRWFRAPLRFPRVAPSPAVIEGGVVIVAPADGRHLSAYDVESGKLRWRTLYPLPRGGRTWHFLGTANDGRRTVALLAGTSLKAFDIRSGALAWEGRFQDGFGHLNATIGRGVIADGQVLVPTEMGLVRFDLAREGSYLGRLPWPHDVDAGNILPLPRVCLIAARDRVKGFYSWERIAQDLQAKQRLHPEDPKVLLDAGEIYRAGGAFDRAVAAFEEARVLATRVAAPAAVERAREGLYRTWLAAGAAQAIDKPRLAKNAIDRALTEAASAREKVDARLRLDGLLIDDSAARIENLEALVKVGAGVVADVPGHPQPVPVRAVAMLRLAEARLEQSEPGPALDILQRLLAEEGDVRIGDRPARFEAKARIDEIRRTEGEAVYAPYEAEAKRELDAARTSGDGPRLEGILRRFPNAAVVPETMVHVASERLARDETGAARQALLDLLENHPDSPWAVKGAEVLVRVLEKLGQDGGMRYTALWLRTHHGIEIELDLPIERPPPPREAKGPLREIRFEEATGESWGREIRPKTPPGVRSPLALFQDGDRLLGFDLPEARVAFDLYPGICSRAVWDDGIAVLAVRGALRAVSGDDGAEMWHLPVQGTLTDLVTAHGLVFGMVHEVEPQSSVGKRSVIAVDLASGDLFWKRALDSSEYRSMFVSETEVLLYQQRYRGNKVWPAVLVYDGLTGHLRRMINLPPGRVQSGPVVAGRRIVYVARDAAGSGSPLRYRITGADIDGDSAPWTRPLPGSRESTALLEGDNRIVVLQSDGFLSGVRASDGTPLDQTRILGGRESERINPYPFTRARLDGDTLLLMPRLRKAPAFVGAWSTRTGKLLWEHKADDPDLPSRAQVEIAGAQALVLMAWSRQRETARVVLQVLNRRRGTVQDEVEPMGLGAQNGVLTMAHGWGTVVVFGNDGAVMYATDR